MPPTDSPNESFSGQPARLIPTFGVSGGVEAEMRVTSATLAVLSVVRDFSAAVLNPLGAPSALKASVEAFAETAFKMSDGSIVRPDGLIRVTYGKRTFVVLVEVKTGSDRLDASQINRYWEVARSNGFDAVLTISNELAVAGVHPTSGLKVRSNSAVKVHHLSWTALVAKAITCKVHKGVSDPEQSWLLGELIRYLESDASGVVQFDDMGPNWKAIRDSARDGTLSSRTDGLVDIIERWDQTIRFASLRLGSEIGADVEQVFPRGQTDPKARQQAHADSICSSGVLRGSLKVPNAVGPLNVEADLRARRVVTSIDVTAPNDRKNKARVTWLLRQLGEDQQPSLEIEAWGRNARQPVTWDVARVREDPSCLEDEARREIARFRIVCRSEMGLARNSGSRSAGFVQSVVGAIDQFYESVAQRLFSFVPKAPPIRRRAVEAAAVEDVPVSVPTSPTEEDVQAALPSFGASTGHEEALEPVFP